MVGPPGCGSGRRLRSIARLVRPASEQSVEFASGSSSALLATVQYNKLPFEPYEAGWLQW